MAGLLFTCAWLLKPQAKPQGEGSSNSSLATEAVDSKIPYIRSSDHRAFTG